MQRRRGAESQRAPRAFGLPPGVEASTIWNTDATDTTDLTDPVLVARELHAQRAGIFLRTAARAASRGVTSGGAKERFVPARGARIRRCAEHPPCLCASAPPRLRASALGSSQTLTRRGAQPACDPARQSMNRGRCSTVGMTHTGAPRTSLCLWRATKSYAPSRIGRGTSAPSQASTRHGPPR